MIKFILTISIIMFFSHEAKTESKDEKIKIKEIISDFTSPETNESFSFSPNGNLVSYTVFNGFNYNFIIYDVEKKISTIVKTNYGAKNDTSLHWIGSKSFIIQSISPYNVHLKKYSVHTGDKLTIEKTNLISDYFIIDGLPLLEDTIIVGKHSDGNGINTFKLQLSESNLKKQLTPKSRTNRSVENYDGWLFNSNGAIKVTYRNSANGSSLKINDNGRWKEVFEEKESSIHPISISNNGDTLYLLKTKDKKSSLLTYDFIKKTFNEHSYQIKQHNPSGFVTNKSTGELYALTYIYNGQKRYEFINDLAKKLHDDIREKIKETSFYIVDSTKKGNRHIIYAFDSNNAGEYYLYNSENKALTLLNYRKPSVSKYKLKKSVVIKNQSIDGLTIESYLTPSTFGYNSSPLVVLPHGGPIGIRDFNYYDEEVHLLSQIGYSVLQTNYRGSSGFGKEFLLAGKKQWGRLIEQDILSATNHAVNTFTIPKDKVCIYGASYGGYSALMSVIMYPGIFQCAISYAGVTDLTLLYTEYEYHKNSELENFYKEFIGDPNIEWLTLLNNSPTRNINSLNAPVFIAHGAKDDIVDMEHFFRLEYLLEKNNKKFLSHLFKNEEHSINYINNKNIFYMKMYNFLQNSINK
ncbi:MAG: S9 family peptidase [Kangiellaceae bacterium]|nr:S9 family peptidase [Kangiellaceae bacterium]